MEELWFLLEIFASSAIAQKLFYVIVHIPNVILICVALYVIGVDLYYVKDLRTVI